MTLKLRITNYDADIDKIFIGYKLLVTKLIIIKLFRCV